MSIERIIYIVVGLVLFVWAIVMMVSDEPSSVSQDSIDVIQNLVLGGLALGLAAKSR